MSVTLNNGELTVNITGLSTGAIATKGKSDGRWYWEVKCLSGTYPAFGVGLIGAENSGWVSDSIIYTSGAIRNNTNYTSGLETFSINDIIGIAIDIDLKSIVFYKNGAAMSQSPYNLSFLPKGDVYPFITRASSSGSALMEINFGATPFVYPIPEGYKPYNIFITNKILLSSRDGKVISTEIPAPPIDLVPKMTTNTAPSGVVTASSASTSGIEFRVFDKNKTTTGAWLTNNKTSGWIQYRFSQPSIVNRYGIAPQASALARSPKNWRILASNTGVFTGEETVLDSRENVTSWDADTKYFDFNNNNPYLYYRLEIIENNGDSTYTGLAELEFLQRIPQSMIILSSFGEEDFIKYGTNSLNLDRMYTTCKNFNKEFLTLGSGKTFEHTVDLSKRRVDKIVLE